MFDTHKAAEAIGLANSAFSSVKTALDLAKNSSDCALKTEISLALDSVLALKVGVHELAEENRSLKEELNLKAKVTRTSEFGYYFMEGDLDPLCPKCYEGNGKLIHLPPSKPWGDNTRRICIECRQIFMKKEPQSAPTRLHRGPNSWMS